MSTQLLASRPPSLLLRRGRPVHVHDDAARRCAPVGSAAHPAADVRPHTAATRRFTPLLVLAAVLPIVMPVGLPIVVVDEHGPYL